MAYGKRYYFDVSSKNETDTITYTVEIWEKDYVGDADRFDTGPSPLTGQILANSDDPFSPVLASSVTLFLDITDFTGDLPDFGSYDDRKYWVKVYANNPDYYVWQGFMMNDAVSVPFTTGRLFLQIVCVDGLGLLNNIKYEPSDADINVLEDLSTTITNCLNKIELPDGYNINYLCNIYEENMDTNISVFKQSYYPPRNYLNSDFTYKTCYEVLEIICRAFGCAVYQSNGEWWVENLGDRAADYVNFFQTTNLNGVETKVNRGKMREIKPYASVSSTPWYFQENNQVKITRKGYPIIELSHSVGFAYQCIDNGTMTRLSAGFPTNWVKSSTGSVTLGSLGPYNAIVLQPTGSGPTQRVASVAALSSAKGYVGDQINLSFWIDGQASPSSTTPKCYLQVMLQNAALDFYYLDSTNNWVFSAIMPTLTQNYAVYGNTSGAYESVSVTTPPLPDEGNLFFAWYTDNIDTFACTVGNVVMTFQNAYQYQKITGKLDANSSYKKTVDIFMGMQSGNDYSEIGCLVNSSNEALISWLQPGTAGTYNSVARIVAQQYVNILGQMQINFSATLRGLYDDRFEVGPVLKRRPHIIGLADVVTVQDGTGGSLDVDGRYYVTGAADFNYTEDTMNATLLQTSKTDLSATFTDQLTTKQ